MADMRITANAVVPPSKHAHREEAVEITAEVDCMLWFDDGFAVGLKKGGKCFLAFDDDGYHHFEVEYTIPLLAVKETVSVAEANFGGTSVVTESSVMTAKVAAGPTGDIIVP